MIGDGGEVGGDGDSEGDSETEVDEDGKVDTSSEARVIVAVTCKFMSQGGGKRTVHACVTVHMPVPHGHNRQTHSCDHCIQCASLLEKKMEVSDREFSAISTAPMDGNHLVTDHASIYIFITIVITIDAT